MEEDLVGNDSNRSVQQDNNSVSKKEETTLDLSKKLTKEEAEEIKQ